MSTNDVIKKYENSGVRITIRELDKHDLLIEGTRDGLLFLAQLITACAEDPDEDGVGISPFGAGNSWFTQQSNKGMYIHCIRSHGISNNG